jgi:hypothetical protein
MARGKWDQQGRFDADASSRRLDNLALVPASLLPHRTTYQRLANQLPAGAVLVVLPTEPSPERQTLQKAAARLRAKGHAIATLTVDEVLGQSRPARALREAEVLGLPRPLTAPPTPAEPLATLGPAASPADDHPASTVPPFVHELRLVRIDASALPARFEVLSWQPTLWGEPALMRWRGTVGQAASRDVVVPGDVSDRLVAATRFVEGRLRAGFWIADWQ